MTCSRCEGFMGEEHCLDMEGAFGEMWTTSLRCMNCGRIHDAVIEQHQMACQGKVLAFPTGVPDSQEDEVSLGAESFMSKAACRTLGERPLYACRRIMASILIIDDEDTIRGLLRAVLETEGYEVTEAANGRIGLEQYRQKPTDLVITDILMPELNGLDLLLELTSDFLDAKVIAISGAGEETNVLNVAKLLGARQTFKKPFDLPLLLGAVRYELAH